MSQCHRWPSLPSWTVPLIFPSLLSCGIHSLVKRGTACSTHSQWPMRSQHSLCLVSLGHCKCYRHLVTGHWLYFCSSPAPLYIWSITMSRWVHTLKIFNHTATCFQNPSFALYVCSPNWSTDTVVPRSEWWQTGHLPWSYLACWVRFSTCRTYQLRFPVGSCLAGRQSAPHVLVPFE